MEENETEMFSCRHWPLESTDAVLDGKLGMFLSIFGDIRTLVRLRLAPAHLNRK